MAYKARSPIITTRPITVSGSSFVGLDLEIVSVEANLVASVATLIDYDNVRKDTGSFYASGGCTVDASHEGDWEVDLFMKIQVVGDPSSAAAEIMLNGVSKRLGNHEAGGTAGYSYFDIVIPSFTLYGLVAGDLIRAQATCFSDNGFGSAGSYLRCRYLGPAS